VSEFYARRRAITADVTSFAFFVLGFLLAAPFAWPTLRASFENGSYDKGLAVFVVRIFGSGLAAGVCGYGVGAVAGRVWQAYHQARRAKRPSIDTLEERARSDARSAAQPATIAATDERTDGLKRAPAAMTCRVGPLTPALFDTFARRGAARAADRRYTESATTEILTLAAWDGLDIAGVARLLSDGHGALFITDFAVDPHYVASVVEQALLDGAKLHVPTGGRLTRV
jgi:hypothetical protein